MMEALNRIQVEWRHNHRFRWGILIIIMLLWAYLLLLIGDLAGSLNKKAANIREESQRLEPFLNEKIWSQREQDTKDLFNAIDAMVWRDPDVNVLEAKIQDEIRRLSGASGLNLKSIAASRPKVKKFAHPRALAENWEEIKIHISFEYQMESFMAFSAELARMQPAVMVDGFSLLQFSSPMRGEMDLRIIAANKKELSAGPQE
jgi:hypothetical protein